MATKIKIPGNWLDQRSDFDINTFLLGQGFTVTLRQRSSFLWTITIAETLNAGQQAALAIALEQELNIITFEVI